MIRLRLTIDEREIIEKALEGKISDLRMEIANTDRPEYRNLLRTRKHAIGKLPASIKPPEEVA